MSGWPRFWIEVLEYRFFYLFFLGVREPGAFCTELRVLFLRDYLCDQGS